jgi:hypothetical protein
MKSGEHLSEKGFKEILNLRASLNKGLSLPLNTAFPGTVAAPRPSVDVRLSPSVGSSEWVAGFRFG